MPEVTPDKNLEVYRQCEIRRPSPPGTIDLGDRVIAKPAGYYFDVVWIKADLARVGAQVTDAAGRQWTIAETYGARPMAGGRWSFH
jgi:hypothetical protein